MIFGQTFAPQDLGVIALLIVLEGVLSIDNALVLALLAKRLPKSQQAKALTYGLIGAFLFRFVAIGAAAYLLQWRIVKLIGGGYLLWIAGSHLIAQWRHKAEKRREGETEQSGTGGEQAAAGFWMTVATIELTDIAFAIDSILAAIALVGSAPAGHVGPHPKFWVIVTGGVIGVLLMRVAAAMFIRLLERFPRFEASAYLLVAVIGCKLLVDWGFNSEQQPHRVDFHDPGAIAFWVFWVLMAVCLGFGFVPQKSGKKGLGVRG